MKYYKFRLASFKNSLLAFNQTLTCESSVLMIPSVVVSLILQYIVVSLTYIIILKKLFTDGKSFIYIKNSNGPSIDPWGTSVVIGSLSDICLSNSTYCNRSEK